jgi:molybdenum cofactor biosynthesis enzyme MoaA
LRKKCKYLRIRVTDKCNLKCKWCHNEGGVNTHSSEELSPAQIEKAVRFLTEFGFKKIKLVGGEPTVRNDLEEIVRHLKRIPTIDLSMISNGTLLTQKEISNLYNAGLKRINLSINTVRPNIFFEHQFGKSNLLETTLDSIKLLIDIGMDKPKVNFIYLGPENENDLLMLIDLLKEYHIKLTILNILPGFGADTNYPFISTACLIDKVISLGCNDVTVEEDENSFSALQFTLKNGVVIEVGHHLLGQEFVYKSCYDCSVRATCMETVYSQRLTPNGFLQPCLLRSDNLFDLRPFIFGEVDQDSYTNKVVSFLTDL